MKRIGPGLLLFAVLAAFVSWGVGHAKAQQPNVFEVVIPLPSLNQPVNYPPSTGITTLKQVVHSVSAYADGKFCARVVVAEATADVVMYIGLPDQPAACSTGGTTVKFYNGNCYDLSATLTVQLGTRTTFMNFAPLPPHSVLTGESVGCVPSAPPIVFPTPEPRTPPPGGIAPPTSNIAPQAPFTPTPVLSLIPVPVERLPGGIRPPDTGDAGLADN